jgi:hypothetical protein
LSLVIAILTVALIAVVVLVVSAPLRAARRAPSELGGSSAGEQGGTAATGSGPSPAQVATRMELEAAREAKYREIRDAELDYRTGKLSLEDYEAIDAELRAEALEILNRIEDAGS